MADIKTRIGAPFQIKWKVKNPRTQMTVAVDKDDGAGHGTDPVPVKLVAGNFVYKVTPTIAGTFTYTITSTIPPAKKDGDPVVETKTTDAEVVAITSLRDWPKLTNLDPATLASMRTNRSHVIANPSLKKNGIGLMYGGKSPAWPTGLPPANTTDFTDTDQKIQVAIKAEVGGEGGASAINSYDGVILTWGSGFAHGKGGGTLEKWVAAFFSASPDGMNYLLDYGITLDSGTWKVVDTTQDSGPVLTDDAALQLFRTDAQLCSVLIEVAEGKFAQAVEDAQWGVLKANYISKIPAWAKSWDIMVIRFCLHASMWGYGVTFATFQDTDGDKEAVLRKEVSKMTGGATSACGNGGVLVAATSQGGKNFPASTVLHNLGAGTMLTLLGTLTPAAATDAMSKAVAGDIFFDHTGCYVCKTSQYFQLKAKATNT